LAETLAILKPRLRRTYATGSICFQRIKRDPNAGRSRCARRWRAPDDFTGAALRHDQAASAGGENASPVPVESYAGVVLAREERPSGAFFSVRLVHRDPQLSVTLRAASNRGASIDAWRQWAAYCAMPALIERGASQWEIIEPPLAGADSLPALPRRRWGALVETALAPCFSP
jgi:hypothetical protein